MDDYLAANRRLWDEWTAINAASAFYDVEAFKRGGVRLRDWEIEEVGSVSGKQLLHLQCHFGLDTLSWGPPRSESHWRRLLRGGDRTRSDAGGRNRR